MFNKLLSFIMEEEYEFPQVWQFKEIKFKTKFQTKYYEKMIGESNMIQDMKGNPGIKACLIITNMRIIWHSANDKNTNISIGFDAIHQIFTKEDIISNKLLYILIIKAYNNQCRYEFKFMGYGRQEHELFNKITFYFKQMVATRQMRDLKISNDKFQLCQNQQIKSKYDICRFEINDQAFNVIVTLTNARIIIINKINNGANYSISWIMISGLSYVQREYGRAIKIKARGQLIDSTIYLGCREKNQGTKILKEIMSFGETYSKHPYIGVQYELQSNDTQKQANFIFDQIVQLEDSGLSINSNLRLYGQERQKGSFSNAFYCEQLGILMQKFPQGVTRNDIWQFLDN